MSEKPLSANHFRSTLPGSDHIDSKKPDLVRDIPRTVDCRLTANIFQGFSILVLSIVGALIGYRAVEEWQWVAAAAGAVIGIIAATLTTGFILMFFPQRVPLTGVEDAIAKYRRIWRRYNVLVCFYFLWGVMWIAWIYFAPEDIIWDVVPAILWLVCFGVLIYHISLLDLWLCPSCGQNFARQHRFRRLFQRFPHECRKCKFKIEKEAL